MTTETPTVAEAMVHNLGKIANALDDLKRLGIPDSVLMAYLRQKTHLKVHDIQAVLDGLKELSREMRPRT
jgi:hypothetical protein